MVAFLLEAKNGGFAGGFFLACEAFSENVRPFIHRLRLLFFFAFFFFLVVKLKWELACAH